jgi:CCR4-NOT transcription complex subunit 1
VRILLGSERIRTQSGERSLLKNLGSWLGKLTIARNRPVRHRDLDLKGILYEAYEQGKMIAVLPFVNKARSRARHMPDLASQTITCSLLLSMHKHVYSVTRCGFGLLAWILCCCCRRPVSPVLG